MKSKFIMLLVFCGVTFFSGIVIAQSGSTTANSKHFKKAFSFLTSGDFQGGLKALNSIKKTNIEEKNLKYYLAGVFHIKLGGYKDAVDSFSLVNEQAKYPKDFHYQFGQALYGNDDLSKSIEYFKMAADENVKRTQSLYYVAFIAQTLDENDTATEYYELLLKEKIEDKMKQIAMYKMAEINYAQFKSTKVDPKKEKDEKTKLLVKENILPPYMEAYEVDKKSKMGKDIKNDVKKIKRKYGLGPGKMKNGEIIPENGFSFSVSQNIDYNSNVVTQADDATTQISNTSSALSTTSVTMGNKFAAKKLFFIEPKINISDTRHFRSDPEVYKSDAYSVKPSLKISYEHKLFGKKASLFSEYHYKYDAQDVYKKKNRSFYARENSLKFGEKFNFLSIGSTTVSLGYKRYKSYTASSNAHTTSFSLSQLAIVKGKVFVMTSSMDVKHGETQNNDQNTYTFRVDYIHSNFLKNTTLKANLGITFTNPRDQRPTRGYEQLWNPGVGMDYKINDDFTGGLSYNFNESRSNDTANYAYTQHVTALNISYAY